jgi:Coenzyme PQQ synthesis protein D (PqqD)
MSVDVDSVIVQNSEPIASRVGNEVVLISMRADTLFGLGTVGSEIWNLIQAPRRVGDICAALVRDFDVDAATCEREVLDFLESLVARELARIIA